MRTALLCASLLALAGCETNLIDNPSFDRWCGDGKLCDWTNDGGKIERVGSWHERDYAVSFVAKDTQISQRSTYTVPGSCIRFEMIADVDARAELKLEVDFHDDGAVDFSQLIPASNWEPVALVVHTPRSYAKVRYILRKQGVGRAVLAQLWADTTGGCADSSE